MPTLLVCLEVSQQQNSSRTFLIAQWVSQIKVTFNDHDKRGTKRTEGKRGEFNNFYRLIQFQLSCLAPLKKFRLPSSQMFLFQAFPERNDPGTLSMSKHLFKMLDPQKVSIEFCIPRSDPQYPQTEAGSSKQCVTRTLRISSVSITIILISLYIRSLHVTKSATRGQ